MRGMTLTERKAVRLALHLAIQWELSLADAYHNNKAEQAVRDARRNIKRFRRVLNKHFGGERPDPALTVVGKTINIFELATKPPSRFKPGSNSDG